MGYPYFQGKWCLPFNFRNDLPKLDLLAGQKVNQPGPLSQPFHLSQLSFQMMDQVGDQGPRLLGYEVGAWVVFGSDQNEIVTHEIEYLRHLHR